MAAAGARAIVLPSFDDEKTVFGDNSLAACAARYRKAGAETVVVKNGGGDMLFAGIDVVLFALHGIRGIGHRWTRRKKQYRARVGGEA